MLTLAHCTIYSINPGSSAPLKCFPSTTEVFLAHTGAIQIRLLLFSVGAMWTLEGTIDFDRFLRQKSRFRSISIFWLPQMINVHGHTVCLAGRSTPQLTQPTLPRDGRPSTVWRAGRRARLTMSGFTAAAAAYV